MLCAKREINRYILISLAADNSSAPSNATTATIPTLLPSSSISLPSSNSTVASNTATPTFSNSSPVSALPLSAYDGNGEAEFAKFAEKCHRIDHQDDERDGNFVFCQPMHLQNVTVSKSYPCESLLKHPCFSVNID